ncbi:MAG TPA: ABC transporter permease [Chloroflexia bacterium]|nr:ABC transporter permease [Chloroflexia bacterium]
MEAQQIDFPGFLRGCKAAAWLEYRQLRYYPASLILGAAQQLTAVGVWYFVGRFLSAGANEAVLNYGGNYVAYVLLGVLLNQVALATLDGPFQIISEAFWDKRLETYRLAVHGIWSNIMGRVAWQVLFATTLQALAFILVLALGGIPVHSNVNVPLVGLTCLMLIGSNLGLGLAGASLFFLLEVKSGQDPITWAYRYLVMLVSGLYVPLSLLPAWLNSFSKFLPQTSAFSAVRALLLTGAGWSSPLVSENIVSLALATVITLGAGIFLLNFSLRRAEKKAGIGVLV